MRAHEILNEMVVRTPQGDDNPNLIAHRDSIWLLPDRNEEIEPEIAEDIAARTGLPVRELFDDLYDEHDGRPDILFGRLYNDSLYVMHNSDTGYNPVTSLLIKKVVKQLGLSSVNQSHMGYAGDENEIETYRHELQGRIPDIVYHGTNTRFMREILSKGLGPNENANWPRVGKFYDRVFLTARQEYAQFHAMRSAKKGGTPIIIATRIPNRDLIVPDFDIAGTYYGAGHERTNAAGYTDTMRSSGHYAHVGPSLSDINKHSAKTDFTRETGVFAYKGRIPSSFFEYFIVPGDSFEDNVINDHAVRVAPADIRRALELINEYGFYDPNWEDEEEEDEDNW